MALVTMATAVSAEYKRTSHNPELDSLLTSVAKKKKQFQTNNNLELIN
jgi:hypothetical protein